VVLTHLAVFGIVGQRHPGGGCASLPQAYAPLQSMTRGSVHRSASLSRGFSPPQRYPAVEIHHSQVFTCLGQVAPSRLPCASALCSLDGLPRILSTRCAHGVRPSELALCHSRDASRRPQSPLFAMATPSPFSVCLTCTVNGASSRGLEDGFASGVGLQPVGTRRAGL
jgi:hypothetical protein